MALASITSSVTGRCPSVTGTGLFYCLDDTSVEITRGSKKWFGGFKRATFPLYIYIEYILTVPEITWKMGEILKENFELLMSNGRMLARQASSIPIFLQQGSLKPSLS